MLRTIDGRALALALALALAAAAAAAGAGAGGAATADPTYVLLPAGLLTSVLAGDHNRGPQPMPAIAMRELPVTQGEFLRFVQAQPAWQRSRVALLMVSFDPERDTVAVLRNTAEQRELDPAQWTLARTDAASVRKLAAVLGIRYKALPNGVFNHSTDLVLLDKDGRIAGRTARLGSADPAFVTKVQAAAAAALL